ncbi:MAG TPA: recombination protein RecR, partial [Bacteroidales bacterium]|nr:recombination protein RecR [Bacteroidales bacterium]
MISFSSKIFEKAVGELAKLPGIGEKTAMRLALYLMRKDPLQANALGNSIITMRNEIKFCKICHNISDTDICNICSNPKRDQTTICIVEDIQDIIAIEKTNKYYG